MRTVGKLAVLQSYLVEATTDFTDNDKNYQESLMYYPEDESKALDRCRIIQAEMTARLTTQLEFVIQVTHGFFAQKVPKIGRAHV